MFMSFHVKLVDGIYISRKVRLTETTSNTLQKYLKVTLRQNVRTECTECTNTPGVCIELIKIVVKEFATQN